MPGLERVLTWPGETCEDVEEIAVPEDKLDAAFGGERTKGHLDRDGC